MVGRRDGDEAASGLPHKPMIVVPNHLVEQWGAAFMTLYPHANIFVAGKDAFRRGQPPEGHVAHRHRQLRRGHRLAQILRASSRLR